MSIRDWLIVVGVVILLGVIADLIRRFLQRGKLRLAIDKKYADLPDADLGAELPNGGARVVNTDSFDQAPSLSESPVKAAVSAPQPRAEPEAKKRVIIDDALMASPASVGEHDESNEWDVDPLLGRDRSNDTEVDLLLEREFKGVGQGADRWVEPSVPPRVEPRSTDTETTSDRADRLVGAEGLAETLSDTLAEPSVIEPVSAAVEPPTEEQIEQSVQEAVAQESALDSGASLLVKGPSDSGSIGLVADEVLDLERPVHELLVRQQSAAPSATEAESGTALPPMAGRKEPSVSEPERSEERDNTAVQKKVTAKPKSAKSPKKSSRKRAEPRAEEQPSFFDLHPDLAPDVEVPEAKPKSRRRRKKAKQGEPDLAPQPEAAVEPQVLVVNVQAKREPFAGPVLLKLIAACGLEFGSEMAIFHRYEGDDGQGALQFSMANAIAPGTFDPTTADQFSTPAITFFMQLADPADRMNAFECMLATAQCVADNLHGELKDENRSSLRTQTIEHYRQKVREYERKQLTRRV